MPSRSRWIRTPIALAIVGIVILAAGGAAYAAKSETARSTPVRAADESAPSPEAREAREAAERHEAREAEERRERAERREAREAALRRAPAGSTSRVQMFEPETVVPSQVAGITGSAIVNFTDLAREEQARRMLIPAPLVRPRVTTELNESEEMEHGPEDEPFPPGWDVPSLVSPVLNIASPSPTSSFIGLDDIAMVDSSYIIIPPDVAGGVGPTKVMDSFNNNYRIQDKTTGATLLTLGTATFWNPVVTNKALLNQLTDPRTTYDPIQNRWIVCMQTTNNPGMLLFGVSQSSDPAGSWFLYAITPGFTSSPVLDFPVIGFNKNWIAITVNAFSSGGLFNRGGCLIANYPQAAAGTLSTVSIVSQTLGTHFSTAPCVTISATEDTLFLALRRSTTQYSIDRITGTPAAPVYASGGTVTRTGGAWAVPTSGNLLPQSAPNAGASSCGATPCKIETQDDNIRSSPVYRVDSSTGRGFIYFTQTVGLPSAGQTHTGIQWTKVTPSTTPVFADGGRIEDATATATNGGKWYAYPSIAVNSVGDWIIGYSQFSSAQHPAAGYSFHDHTDGLGVMRDPLVYKAGDDYYHKDFGSGRNRWGDFSAAQVDPSDDQTLWVLQEYAKTRTSTDDGTTGANGSKWSSYWASVQSSFIITASAGANGSISPNGGVSVSPGGGQTFTITPNACYHIADVVVDGSSRGAVASYSFTNVTANHTISATFAIDTYTINASASANGSISPNGAVSVNCGSNQAFTITPAACYHVADVVVDGSSRGALTSYTFSNVLANHTIAASFAINTYTIAASAGANGSITPSGTVNLNCGANQSFAIAGAACYHVADVVVDGSSRGAVSNYTFSNVQANHTITASFAIDVYTINASAGANGSITPSGAVSVNCGAAQAFTIAANSNYYIQNVVVDGNSVGSTASYTFSNVTANHTISASFAPDLATIAVASTSTVLCPTHTCETLPVTISRSGTGAVLGFSVTFQLSPQLTLCAGTSSVVQGSFLSSAGMTLFNVIDHGGGSYSADGAVIDNCGATGSSGTLFTIAVASSSPSGPGTVTITSLKLRDCANLTLSTAAGPPATVPIDNAAPVVAVTSPNGGETWAIASSQSITWTATDNVGVVNVDLAYSTDGGATYPNVIAVAVANTGSYPWTVPNVTTSQARVRVTAHDVNCSSSADASDADFTIGTPAYTITASAGAGGSISPSGALAVSSGGSQSFTISADPCYSITDVVVDGSSRGAVSSYSFTNVTADHTISVSFTLRTYAIQTASGPNGTISPSGTVSVNCGADQTFTLTPAACYHVVDVVVDGSSRGPVSAYTFLNVQANHSIAGVFAANTLAASAVTDLGASQLRTGNDTDGTTKIQLSWSTPAGAVSVEVWRRGFSNYPLYDNSPGAGSVPPVPGAYPPAGWTLTAVTASGQYDEPATRDFWYYVAYARDACGNVSGVSNMTGGTLDYHLGDVTNGFVLGQGNNSVTTADVSLLGAHYGLTGGALAGFEYLDVGPTTDFSVNARPTTDSKTDFEDLVMFGLNFTPTASLVARPVPRAPSAAAMADEIEIQAPGTVPSGGVFDVLIRLASGSGALQAVSVKLGWNAATVAPLSMTEGAYVTDNDGLMYSPCPGQADVVLLAPRAPGMLGSGVLALVRFQVVAAGPAGITATQVLGRDNTNQPVTVAVNSATLSVDAAPAMTELNPVIPNPSHGQSTFDFALSKAGAADLSVYSVDGRRVRTVMHGQRAAGRYQIQWDGADEHGTPARSGVYFVRLEAAGQTMTRLMTLMR